MNIGFSICIIISGAQGIYDVGWNGGFCLILFVRTGIASGLFSVRCWYPVYWVEERSFLVSKERSDIRK